MRHCLRALLKAGRVGMADRLFGNAFQMFEATDREQSPEALCEYGGGR